MPEDDPAVTRPWLMFSPEPKPSAQPSEHTASNQANCTARRVITNPSHAAQPRPRPQPIKQRSSPSQGRATRQLLHVGPGCSPDTAMWAIPASLLEAGFGEELGFHGCVVR